MSLANIQHLVLTLSIDPAFSDQFYQDPTHAQKQFGLTDQEVEWARSIPQEAIEAFQATVSAKRSRRAENYLSRTQFRLSPSERMASAREFARMHVMRSNEWLKKAGDYLSLVESRVQGNSQDANLLRDLIAFEKWLYAFSCEEITEQSGLGYVVAASVRVAEFPFPAEPLITDQVNKTNMARVIDGYGTNGYVLAQRVGNQVDLYEIDECYYNLIRSSGEPCSLEELTARAERIAQELGLDKNPQEMIAELQEFGILILLEEGDQSWQEA